MGNGFRGLQSFSRSRRDPSGLPSVVWSRPVTSRRGPQARTPAKLPTAPSVLLPEEVLKVRRHLGRGQPVEPGPADPPEAQPPEVTPQLQLPGPELLRRV